MSDISSDDVEAVQREGFPAFCRLVERALRRQWLAEANARHVIAPGEQFVSLTGLIAGGVNTVIVNEQAGNDSAAQWDSWLMGMVILGTCSL